MRKRSVDAGAWAAAVLASVALVSSSTAQAQVKLQYKFPEGQKLTYKTTETTEQVLKLAGQAFDNDAKETVLTSWTFGKKRENATQPIEVRIEAYASESSLPGGVTVSFDSAGPSCKISNPDLAYLGDVYKLLSHLDYTVVLDAQNKVKAVEGTEKLLADSEKLNDLAKRTIRDAIDSHKSEFEENHGNLPDALARPGESWERIDKRLSATVRPLPSTEDSNTRVPRNTAMRRSRRSTSRRPRSSTRWIPTRLRPSNCSRATSRSNLATGSSSSTGRRAASSRQS